MDRGAVTRLLGPTPTAALLARSARASARKPPRRQSLLMPPVALPTAYRRSHRECRHGTRARSCRLPLVRAGSPAAGVAAGLPVLWIPRLGLLVEPDRARSNL